KISARRLTELCRSPDEARHRLVEVGVDELRRRILAAHALHSLPEQPVVVLSQPVEPPEAPRPTIIRRRRRRRVGCRVLGQLHRHAPRRRRPRHHHVPRSFLH
ncbi:Os05g0210450, partial [Oryza sativa Japonica Group]